MRLDLFLKSSRLCARRTTAQRLCEAGFLSINGNPAKSSATVKPDDLLTIRCRDEIRTVQVLSLPTTRQTSRSEAGTLYKVVSETKVDPEELELLPSTPE
ncbi:MAG: RNA-binding S4 domain-containing protein [bacterium]